MSLFALLPQNQTCAANVNPGTGYTNDFTSQPPAADWTTRSFGTGTGPAAASEITTIAGLNTAVQTNSANLFSAQCASATGTPPSASGTAVWSSAGGYLQTRPTSVAATLLMARLVNNTGTNATAVHINYDYTNRASATEEIAGHLVFYSLTGAANSWSNLPAFSQASPGTLSADLTLSGVWSNGATLYLLWADDNGSGSPDSALDIDNFFISVIGPATVPLSCTLTSPANGQSFGAIAAVTLTATAGPGEGATITGVGFYDVINGFLGSALNAPYSLSANLDVGVYSLYAVATNSLGVQIFSATNTITVTNVPFAVTLVNPVNGLSAAAPANVNLDAIVNPGSGATVASVAFYEVAAGWRSTFLNPPYSTIADLSAGTYRFYAVATNSLGAVTFSETNTVTVTNIPFTVALVSPTNGFSATAPANVTLQAIVNAGSFATDTGVAFYEVTSGFVGSDVYPPYTNTLNLGAGIYQFYAVATNSLGATCFSPTNTITITNIPLSVTLISPANGSSAAAPANVTLLATVTAGSGATAGGVGFYDLSNGFLASVLNAPYSKVVSLQTGAYQIYAVATNGLGAIAFSRTNILTVTNVLFTVTLLSPTNTASFGSPASVPLAATVNAGTGASPRGVGFYDVTNGFLLSALASPFSNNIPLSSGIYSIYAIATNTLDATACSATNTIIVTNVPLSITLNTPTNGAAYGSGAAVICQATPNPGSSGTPIDSVTFYMLNNGSPTLLFTDTSPPYSNQVSGLAEGTYGFFAVVTNTDAQSAISRTNLISVSSVVSGAVVRGPYMGSRGETNINIRWCTREASVGRVRYGTTLGNLTAFADEPTSGTNHSVTLTGLTPETKYYYSIGTTAGTLIGSANYYFTTAPPIGSARSTRIWFLSDYGQGDAMEATVRDTYLNYITTNGRGTDVWITGGDNDQSFSNGSDAAYQTDMFDILTNVLQNTPIFPTPGNHDGGSSSAYWTIFDLPSQAQVGGYPSSNAHYYSFDYANIHFISLDPFNAATDVNSPMLAWLTNDLAATTQKWIIAYFHAPIYCKVFYDSDTLSQSVAMRQNFVPRLEARGVDLVISGHSHSLQRTSLLHGHYGVSSTFNETNKIDGGNGRVDGTGVYHKTNGVGTVYMVAPTGCGVTRSGTTTHPACLYTINNTAGFLIIDINTNRLDFQMLTSSGSVADYFTILKADTPTVMNPIFLAAPVLVNGVCTLAFQGTPGATYTLQATDSLNHPWLKRLNATVPGEGMIILQDDAAGATNRFYRLIYPPQE